MKGEIEAIKGIFDILRTASQQYTF